MSDHGFKSLGDALGDLVKQLGIKQKLDETRAIESWYQIAGPTINEVTESVWIERKKLFVKVSSSVWRQELHLQRQAWLQRLNETAGSNVVQEIVFR